MRRLQVVTLLFTLTSLSCSVLSGASTPVPGGVETSVAATLTALAPTVLPATPSPAVPTPAPATAVPSTPTVAPLLAVCSIAYSDGASLYCIDAGGSPLLLATADAGLEIQQPSVSSDH